MKARFLTLLTLATLFLSGCTHALHQYHVSDVEPYSKKSKKTRVTATGEQFVVMGFVTETDYVNTAFADLQRKCESGRITGIHTRYSTSHGFFSWTNTVRMTGICVR